MALARSKPLMRLLLITAVCMVVFVQADVDTSAEKNLRICTLAGGLDAVRLSSVPIRRVFEGALEDVELIRKHIVESAHLRGDKAHPLMSLEELSQTLDWRGRNLSREDTTITARIGYYDDRADRVTDKFVTLVNQPFVGNKTTDLAFVESAATILPWMIDRTKFSKGTPTDYERLYTAAWVGSYGEAWMYYPPNLIHVLPGYENVATHETQFIQPNLPPAAIDAPYFTQPYPDLAIPGHAVLTAQAPIYFRGNFMGFHYKDSLDAEDDSHSTSTASATGRTRLGTYVASTGIDISMDSVSTLLLETLEGTITNGSFAMVVGANQDLNTVLISPSTLTKIYPTHTDMNETRVAYNPVDPDLILRDRRNKTYQVSDAIFQPLTSLDNADWKSLASLVHQLQPAERSLTTLDVLLTGQQSPVSFHVFLERWPDVADWATLLFVPKKELDKAIVVEVLEPKNDSLFVAVNADSEQEPSKTETLVLENKGSLDVRIEVEIIPAWLTLLSIDTTSAWLTPHQAPVSDDYSEILPSGEQLTLVFGVNQEQVGTEGYSGVIAVKVQDADKQNNCYFEDVLTTNVHLTVVHMETLQAVRPYGLTLSVITVLSSIGWSIWVVRNATHQVVRASQPMFLHMMCAGILFMGLSLIPLSMDDSSNSMEGCNKACMAFPWLLCLGFSISFSALFSKIRRINMIVANTKSYRRVIVSVGDVMVPFVIICSLNVTLLSIWTAVDPLVWVRGIGDDHQAGPVASSGYCAPSDGTFSIMCAVLLLLVNFIAVFLSLIQLYRARALSAIYSEGKYIALAMGSMMQTFLTGLPVMAIVKDGPQVQYLVKSTIVFLVAMSLLTLIFLPKYIAQRQDHTIRHSITARGNSGAKTPPRAHHQWSSTSESDTPHPTTGTEEQACHGARPGIEVRQCRPASGRCPKSISDISMSHFFQPSRHQEAAAIGRDTFCDEDEDYNELGIESSPLQQTRNQSQLELCPSARREESSVSRPPVKPFRGPSCLETHFEEEEDRSQCHDGQDNQNGPVPSKPERITSHTALESQEDRDGAMQDEIEQLHRMAKEYMAQQGPLTSGTTQTEIEQLHKMANQFKAQEGPPTSHVTTHSEFSDISSIYTMAEMYHGRKLYPNLDNLT